MWKLIPCQYDVSGQIILYSCHVYAISELNCWTNVLYSLYCWKVEGMNRFCLCLLSAVVYSKAYVVHGFLVMYR